MKYIPIYVYLALFPVLGWAQGTASRPEPRPCNGCVILRVTDNGKIQKVFIGYDNPSNLQYFKIKPEAKQRLKAVERVIFVYEKDGLKVFSYIPMLGEQMDEAELEKFSSTQEAVKPKEESKKPAEEGTLGKSKEGKVKNAEQKKIGNQLYYLKTTSTSKKLKDSTGVDIGTIETEGTDWVPAVLDKELVKTLRYEDRLPNSLKILRDHYRKYKRPKKYIEFGGIAGFSHRTVQVVNPLPKRKIYETRLREDKAQFSWAGSLRGGYNITNGHSVYAGLLYLHQQFQSNGKIDWNSGLIGDTTVIHSQNRFDYWGTEIGYSYMYFRKRSEVSVDVGMDFLWANNRNSVHTFTFGPHIAIGPKFRIGSGADLRIMPTFYYNLRSLEKHKSGASQQELATRMFTTGIKMSVRWN